MEKENKPKKKIFKKIIILIMILIIIYAIFVIRNFIILNKVLSQSLEVSKKSNYHYKMTHYSTDSANYVSTEIYVKNSIFKMITNETITWINADTSETIWLDIENKTAQLTENDGYIMPIPAFCYNEFKKLDVLNLSFKSLITTKTIGDTKCYKIKMDYSETWVEKDTSLIRLITSEGYIPWTDIKISENITIYDEWEFDYISDEIVARPDLTDYKIEQNTEN